MHQLEQIFNPFGTHILSFQDIIILPLDLEYNNTTGVIYQIGISTLDTTQIEQVDTAQPQSMLGMISNHLYLLSRDSTRRRRRYWYGHPKIAKDSTIEDTVMSFLTQLDESKRPRHIVLVGQEIGEDIRMLKHCGFDITAMLNITSIIDIAPIAPYFLSNSTRFLSPEKTCLRLGIPTYDFHNAGNDALYTLQALILLFCWYKSQKDAACTWGISTSDRVHRHNLMLECQVDVIRNVAQQRGNVLWPGSPRQREKKTKRR